MFFEKLAHFLAFVVINEATLISLFPLTLPPTQYHTTFLDFHRVVPSNSFGVVIISIIVNYYKYHHYYNALLLLLFPS